MKHEEFVQLRERLRQTRPEIIDCAQLNLYRSLAPRFAAIAASEHLEAPYRCHLAERFLAHLQLPAEWKSRTHVTHGVRRSLAALFQVFARDGMRVTIPADVYPVYLDLARASGVAFTTFTRFPSELEASDAVLFCEPAKPWGTTLDAEQLARLLAWSRERGGLVLLDSAYATPPTSGAMQLVHEGAAMLLASLSKGWLIPDHGGICITPSRQWFERTRPTFTALPKDEQKLRVAYAALTDHAQRPQQVADELTARARMLDELTTTRPEINATRVQGYFAVSTRTFDELLGLGVLGVPVSVFGSNGNLTILSSLDP